ncbi:penicillin-binding protein [Bacillus sp. CGMCC 1.16541]|uniref:penicillin-binding protein n=1 Tax=Bacillus sp. CGMCC 1.16541 TaxID=2185143 RepID=UPI000D73DA41|nr:penicillin-binding protein [Bacillus sp. CGMCC 1.16541]
MNSTQKNKNITIGAAILTSIFALLFFILGSRFFYIQATGKAEGEALAQIAQKKYTRQSTIEGHRGTIYDRRGEPVAHDTGAYTVVAILDKNQTKNKKEPKHVIDPEKTAQQLAPLLEMEEQKLENLLTKDSFQVELGPGGRDISHELKRKIEELQLPGITFVRDAKRLYPNGVFASHILGYAQKDDTGKIVGKMGIEQVFNKQLAETDGYMKYQSARNGIKLPDPKESIVPPKNGDNVYLTIDEKIQTFVEEALSRAEKEYEPEQMMAVVANAKTGEILGMSSRPSFNPNIRDITSYGNPIVEGRYELGSTMKIFTLAAAIEEGAYNGNELYKSGGYRIPEDPSRPIRDHNRGAGWGTITFDEGIRRSSNVAIAMLVNERIGTETYLQYLERFGFTKKTGIDLPNEASSRIVSKYVRDRITTAFGQGSAFSPIQQIQAATAIANEGKMMKPYVIQKVVDGTTGEVKRETKPKLIGEPISKQTSKKVLDILETVVTEEDGTGKPYNIEGYQVAGKTGTAQITDQNGRYQSGHGKNLFSFLGFAPADDPSLIVYVAVKKPKLTLQETGSAPTSMVFNSVMKNSLQYLKIEPEEPKEKNQTKSKVEHGSTVDSYIGQSVTEATTKLKEQGLEPIVVGKGTKVAEQSPNNDERMLKGQKVFIKTDSKLQVPDLTGWSYRDVLRLSEFLELQPSAVGNGFVIEQNIPVNGTIKKGDYLIVKLDSPQKIAKVQQEKSNEEESDEEDEKKPLD